MPPPEMTPVYMCHVCVCVCACVCVRACVNYAFHTHTRTHERTHAHTHRHILHTHTHTHTHTTGGGGEGGIGACHHQRSRDKACLIHCLHVQFVDVFIEREKSQRSLVNSSVIWIYIHRETGEIIG
jgi:hypothetical protein